jgi:hypothetical protein
MPWYFRDTETTSRRLARMNRCRARSACRIASRAFRIVSDRRRPSRSHAPWPWLDGLPPAWRGEARVRRSRGTGGRRRATRETHGAQSARLAHLVRAHLTDIDI